MRNKKYPLFLALGVAVLQAGCAHNTDHTSSLSTSDQIEVSELEQQLKNSQAELAQVKSEYSKAKKSKSKTVEADSLLPPSAKPGECYARVWVEPTYNTLSKTITLQEASESVEIVPAKYEWVPEQVLVKEASSKLVSVPAKYSTVSEQVLVKSAEKYWVSSLTTKKRVSAELLNAARKGGIDLDSAPVNVCYHEHVTPAKTQQVSQKMEVAPASYRIETAPAHYQTIEKQRLSKQASTKLVKVPAKYETFTEQVLDKPAHTIWKKGSGPIQKMDESTGEIMCLVEVPATYKTVTRRRLISPETVKEVSMPAQYETVKVKELVSEASQTRIEIPAKYETVTSTEVISEPTFVWHEVHDNSMTAKSRTGNQVCLLEVPAKYKTVQRKVLESEAYTKTVEIAEVYETKKVKKLISDAQEIRNSIPAQYQEVSYQELDQDGHMEWRSILCETNVTNSLITSLQQKLNQSGYDVGRPDGIVGKKTIEAVNRYQQDNKLPTDRYLNTETLKHLDLL